MYAGAWTPHQQNLVLFVLVDSGGAELPGLGDTFTLEISKAGGAFAASAGVKAEIGSGWYSYLSAAAEADTPGPVALKITGPGIAQQNLEYVVQERVVNGVAFTYTLTDGVTMLPISGAIIRFTPDVGGAALVWVGTTDAFGVARDAAGNLPRLDPGVYYVWRMRSGYSFADPDIETVSL